MRHIFWIGILLSVLLVALPGCASTTDWVKSVFSKIASPADQPQAEQQMVAEFDGAESRFKPASATPDERSPVVMFHVYFGFDRWELNRTAQTDLESLIERLRKNPGLTIDLEGYADSVGARDYNQQLSQKRVESVRRYLVEQGVKPARIRSVGLGQIADDGTSANRAKSRRVTVKVTVASE